MVIIVEKAQQVVSRGMRLEMVQRYVARVTAPTVSIARL